MRILTLGQRINVLRSEKRLTQKELAAQLGVTTGTIAEWEADEATPNLAELSRLSKALNVSSDVLLDATTEDVVVPVTAPKQEPTLIIAPAKKNKKKVWIIGIAVLCVAIIAAAVVLLSQGVFIPEPLLFAEDTAKIEAADASVVTIFCYDYDGELSATGSGFVAFDGKTIITNYHVMTSAYTCKISTNQDISYEVSKILCYSKEQDIAILQLAKDTGLQPLTLGDSSVIKKGETVVAIGSPLGIKNTVSTGVLSGRLMEDGMDVLQFTAPISSGSSGGALFDNNGNVIGITFATIVDGQNLNLAIPIELAADLYDKRSATKKVSAICIEEHPYIPYLELHPEIPTVTLADLRATPKAYNGSVVKIVTYISSIEMNISSKDPYSLYLSEKANVSHNNDLDHQFYRDSGGASALYYVSFLNSSIKHITGTFASGSQIVIVGQFNYYPSRTFDGWRGSLDLYINPDVLPYYIYVIS